MSLTLYYTGASSFLDKQTFAIKSVGGLISQSQVPSGAINTFFDGISNKTEAENLSEYICVALKNETGSDIVDLKAYLIAPTTDNRVKVSIAAIDPDTQTASNGDVLQFFQMTNNRRSKPPFIEKFYNIMSKQAFVEIELSSPAQTGEVITILGVDTAAAESNLSIDETYQLIADAFENDNVYTATFIDKEVKTLITDNADIRKGEQITTTVKHLLIKRIEIGVNTDVVSFSTTGTAALKQAYSFAGGTDNSIIIGDLAKDAYIGLWFQKNIIQVKRDYTKDSTYLFPEQLEKTENLQLVFEY